MFVYMKKKKISALHVFKCSWLNVNVLQVSAIELKKKKHPVWMLDTGFLQQLVVRLFTLSSSLQFAEASTASHSLIRLFLQLDPCSGKGRERTSATSWEVLTVAF